MQSLCGKILVASSRLEDGNFAQTLVLIVRHGESGALGIVLNRPLEMSVAQICQEVLSREGHIQGVVYEGGPCSGPLMVVHTHQTAADSPIIDGLYFSAERENVQWLLEYNDGPIRVFVNYAGWTAGQLEAEMETGSWLSVPATLQRIFDEADNQWSRFMLELALGRPLDGRLIPPDPSVN